jgi:hypothetical protein
VPPEFVAWQIALGIVSGTQQMLPFVKMRWSTLIRSSLDFQLMKEEMK